MDSASSRDFVEKRSNYFTLSQRQRELPLVDKQGKNIGVREYASNGIDHPFTTGERNEPVMEERYPHALKIMPLLVGTISYRFLC